MRVLIVGPGAVGRALGAAMAGAGVDVALLDHDAERARVVREEGVRILRSRVGSTVDDNDVEVCTELDAFVASDPGHRPPFDLLLSCVKAYDTAVAIRSAVPFLTPSAVVVPLSNGLGNLEAAREIWDPRRVGVGTHTYGFLSRERGVVHQTGLGAVKIGAPHDAREVRVGSIVDLFTASGFEAEPCANTALMLWQKAAINCAINPIAGLLDVANGDLLNETLCAPIRAVCGEVVEVSQRDGVTLDLEHLETRIRDVCERTSQNLCSTVVDLRSGRRTEIDSLNGRVVALASEYGIASPINSLLTLLIRDRERKCRSSFDGRALR